MRYYSISDEIILLYHCFRSLSKESVEILLVRYDFAYFRLQIDCNVCFDSCYNSVALMHGIRRMFLIPDHLCQPFERDSVSRDLYFVDSPKCIIDSCRCFQFIILISSFIGDVSAFFFICLKFIIIFKPVMHLHFTILFYYNL